MLTKFNIVDDAGKILGTLPTRDRAVMLADYMAAAIDRDIVEARLELQRLETRRAVWRDAVIVPIETEE